MNWKDLKPHRLNTLPPLEPKKYGALKDSIKTEGYMPEFPVLIYQGELDETPGIIDGVHRHRACLELGVEPALDQFEGSYREASALVLAASIRRSLSVGQIAMLANEQEELIEIIEKEAKANQAVYRGNQHEKQESLSADNDSRKTGEQLAEMFGVSASAINKAKRVSRTSPTLAEKVREGDMSLNEAYTTVVDAGFTNRDDEEMERKVAISQLFSIAMKMVAQDCKAEVKEQIRERMLSDETKTKPILAIKIVGWEEFND